MIANGKQELTKANNDYDTNLVKERQRWIAEKHLHDMRRLEFLLPSKFGKYPDGTQCTKIFINAAGKNSIQAVVGECLADIIDGSIMVGEGKASNNRFNDFVPPPRPVTNAETAQLQHQKESEYRAEYNRINTRFQASESERAKAWRKMMKTKADLDLAHEQIMNGIRQNIKVTQSNFAQIPMPPLRGSVNLAIPREFARQSLAVASYRPPTSTGPGGSTSKYSAAKIRQRKAADGSVAPVTEPKKTKEGLYLRPAGRTRKGMRWDAFAGVWVPQNHP
jgi:hypothetical protein